MNLKFVKIDGDERMEKDLRMHVKIECANEKIQMLVGDHIHKQLVGNKDYINNNIILNIDTYREVNIWVFNECKDIPKIEIPDLHFREWTEKCRASWRRP